MKLWLQDRKAYICARITLPHLANYSIEDAAFGMS